MITSCPACGSDRFSAQLFMDGIIYLDCAQCNLAFDGVLSELRVTSFQEVE